MHRASGLRSRIAVLYLAPLAVLLVLGLVFGRMVFGSSSSGHAALTSAALTKSPSTASPTATTTSAAVAAAAPAPTIKNLGVVKGTYTLAGPAHTTKGSFVVFVLDGAQRVLKTDATAPFAVKVNTKALPNGKYTVTVLLLRKGKTSLVTTSTLQIKNTKSTPKPPAAGSPTPAPAPGGGGGGTNSSYTSQVLSLTNAERAKVGCSALSVSSILAGVAQAHSADMAAKNYFDHNSQNGDSPFDRMKKAGYSFSAAAENIAMGQQTPSDVMTAWMNSPGHKANILNCTYTQIGIGYVTNKSGAPYWTQDFGKPM